MDAEVILGKISQARYHNNKHQTWDAIAWLADALEDVVMTMQANELKAARQQETDNPIPQVESLRWE